MAKQNWFERRVRHRFPSASWSMLAKRGGGACASSGGNSRASHYKQLYDDARSALDAERQAALSAAAQSASDAACQQNEALAASDAEHAGEMNALTGQLRLAQGKLAAAERQVHTITTSKRLLIDEVRSPPIPFCKAEARPGRGLRRRRTHARMPLTILRNASLRLPSLACLPASTRCR